MIRRILFAFFIVTISATSFAAERYPNVVLLLARISVTSLPKGYMAVKGTTDKDNSAIHQAYVNGRMAGLTEQQMGRVARLWEERQRIDDKIQNAGAEFVRIMEFVAREDK